MQQMHMMLRRVMIKQVIHIPQPIIIVNNLATMPKQLNLKIVRQRSGILQFTIIWVALKKKPANRHTIEALSLLMWDVDVQILVMID